MFIPSSTITPSFSTETSNFLFSQSLCFVTQWSMKIFQSCLHLFSWQCKERDVAIGRGSVPAQMTGLTLRQAEPESNACLAASVLLRKGTNYGISRHPCRTSMTWRTAPALFNWLDTSLHWLIRTWMPWQLIFQLKSWLGILL
jgi:hypothetical protein